MRGRTGRSFWKLFGDPRGMAGVLREEGRERASVPVPPLEDVVPR